MEGQWASKESVATRGIETRHVLLKRAVNKTGEANSDFSRGLSMNEARPQSPREWGGILERHARKRKSGILRL